MAVSITIDTSELNGWRRLCQVAPDHARLAFSRSINDAGNAARTAVVRSLGQQAGVPYATVRQSLSTVPAAPSRLAFDLNSQGGHLSLASFDATQVRAGVSARPWGRQRIFRNAFVVRSLGGQVFRRTSAARGPLKKMFGPAIPVEMTQGAPPRAFEESVVARLPKRLAWHLERLMPEHLGGVM